ncbi:MAG: MFS transporter [Thermoplasmata archaeon]|nr:MAG: MFS transporter [Thermoplasmata archaeon]OYT61160.1 MAG: MFS transporter [Thermoplasmatales archaeon ex4484_30]
MNKYIKKISANVLLLGVVSFLNDLSSEMIMPILPMFITALGGSAIIVGLIGGLRDSISSILKVFSGYWSDRIGKRKVFVSCGYLLSGVFKLFLAFSKIWQHILISASLERIGKGLRTAPRDAIIADSMPEERGKGFGIHRALDTSGAILGSIIAFLLFWLFGFSFNTIIFSAATLVFLSLIPLYFVKEKKRKPQDINFKIGLKNLPYHLKLFILISSLFALANFSYMFFILRAQEVFTDKLSMPILLYVLFNIFYALFAIPFGKLSDKIGRKKVIGFGYLLFSLTSLGFAFFNSLMAFIILFALYGIVYAIVDGNQRAYVSDLSPERLRATALGTFHTVIGLASLPSSLIAGFLWQINPSATFIYGAAISIFSAISIIFLKK